MEFPASPLECSMNGFPVWLSRFTPLKIPLISQFSWLLIHSYPMKSHWYCQQWYMKWDMNQQSTIHMIFHWYPIHIPLSLLEWAVHVEATSSAVRGWTLQSGWDHRAFPASVAEALEAGPRALNMWNMEKWWNMPLRYFGFSFLWKWLLISCPFVVSTGLHGLHGSWSGFNRIWLYCTFIQTILFLHWNNRNGPSRGAFIIPTEILPVQPWLRSGSLLIYVPG